MDQESNYITLFIFHLLLVIFVIVCEQVRGVADRIVLGEECKSNILNLISTKLI